MYSYYISLVHIVSLETCQSDRYNGEQAEKEFYQLLNQDSHQKHHPVNHTIYLKNSENTTQLSWDSFYKSFVWWTDVINVSACYLFNNPSKKFLSAQGNKDFLFSKVKTYYGSSYGSFTQNLSRVYVYYFKIQEDCYGYGLSRVLKTLKPFKGITIFFLHPTGTRR